MKLFFTCILFCFAITSFSQSTISFEDSFTPETTDQEKFSIYLDSINKYLYRDVLITQFAFAECQKILDKNTSLNDTTLFGYVIQKIYYAHSMAEPLEAYQIIIDHSYFLESEAIPDKQKANFNYLKAFTYMSMGDTDAAQETHYENLELAESRKDTVRIISSLYSLGQLLNDATALDDAIESLERALSFSKLIKIRPSTLALVYKELGESYSNRNYDTKAIEALDNGYKVSKENDLEVLAYDILLMKGKVYIKRGVIDSARYVYEEVEKMSANSIDQNTILYTQEFLAQFYHAQKMYPQAFGIYEKMLESVDSTNLDRLIYIYGQAHQLSNEMDKPAAAYDFLKKYNEVKKKKEEDIKRQKTEYLKIKFDTERKKRENAILSAEVIQNRAERKQLYFWLILTGLVLVILFGAYYQKQRYTKSLEAEVFKRTENLRKSNDLLNKRNAELDEFNRILSHDLKEPLRGIVSFSQLARKETKDHPKVQKYLDFVDQSGRQLEQLILGVNLYRKSSSTQPKEKQRINLQQLLDKIMVETRKNYPEKQIELACNSSREIVTSKETLESVFRILIDNSIKHNEHELIKIKIDHSLESDMHRFKIIDNGIGIDQKYHQKIFEMFKRLNDRKHYPGSGLGLSIAQRLLERIDGDISVLQSKEMEGSTFLVSIPNNGLD